MKYALEGGKQQSLHWYTVAKSIEVRSTSCRQKSERGITASNDVHSCGYTFTTVLANHTISQKFDVQVSIDISISALVVGGQKGREIPFFTTLTCTVQLIHVHVCTCNWLTWHWSVRLEWVHTWRRRQEWEMISSPRHRTGHRWEEQRGKIGYPRVKGVKF